MYDHSSTAVFLPLAVIAIAFGHTACSDDGGSQASTSSGAGGVGADGGAGGTASGGAGGSALTCGEVLEVDGQPGSLHGVHCIDCIEEGCCAALDACAADAECLACLEDSTPTSCLMNAAVLDLAQCTIDHCAPVECPCIGCNCADDGICDLPGPEPCHCADCADFPGCHDGCDNDGECGSTDSCACPDCEGVCISCNGDGFCDLYQEPCDCSDCEAAAPCQTSNGGAGGGPPR
jgi:hypothetical protein